MTIHIATWDNLPDLLEAPIVLDEVCDEAGTCWVISSVSIKDKTFEAYIRDDPAKLNFFFHYTLCNNSNTQ